MKLSRRKSQLVRRDARWRRRRVSGRVQAAAIPEAATSPRPHAAAARFPRTVRPISRSSPSTAGRCRGGMNGDWKEFHLVAEPVVREMAPGMKAHLWGYNGAVTGADHRGGRGRPGPHLRHQQTARAHDHALARHARAQRHGRRRRPDAAAHRARQDLRLRIRAASRAGPSCITRTPTRWCRWRWA